MNEYEPQRQPREPALSESGNTGAGRPMSVTAETNDLIRRAFASARADEQGWVNLASFGATIKFINPDFDLFRLGFQRLSDLLVACGSVEIRRDEGGKVLAKLRLAPVATSKLLSVTDVGVRPQPVPSRRHLSRWAIFLTRAGRDGGWPFAIEKLREIALKEPWEFGRSKDPANPSPILHSYLRWTFYRLSMEKGKILMSPKLAAFNTGLVDDRYEPIYALFEKNPYEFSARRWPWCFKGFCTEGEGALGKELVGAFKPLPEAAHYFNDPNSMFYDVHAGEPSLDTKHIVEDNCARLPLVFIEDNCPSGFTPRDSSVMSPADQTTYTENFTNAIRADSRRYRSMMNRLEDAVKTALKRAKWNFKTAIPQYFPTRNEMSLLLPLALVSDESPDVALVVKKVPSGAYQGYTILPLAWAYNNARLVCRPNSDWLIPEEITQGQSEDHEEGGEEGSAAPEPPSPPGL